MLNDFQVFNSINECIYKLDNAPHISGRDNSSNKDDGPSWCDTDSYDEARMYMLSGKIYDGLDLDIKKYRTKGTGTKRQNELSVAGHTVIVPLYLQGLPNNMVSSKQKINNKIVTIFYSCQAPHYVSRRELEEGAINLFKNIISLEEQGYRVNLYVGETQGDFGFAIKLKSDREVFNIKKMVFPLISSSFLRRIGFRIKERLYKRWIGGGYGSGLFYLRDYDNFIKTQLKIKRYEIWNYQGKQKDS